MKMRWMALGLVVIVVAGVLSVWLFFHFQKPPDGPPPTPPDHADDHHPDDNGSHDPTTHAAGYRPAPINLAAAGEFLYAGTSGRQRGVDKGAVKFRQAAVLRGMVGTADGAPLAGVEVTVSGRPEFGRTLTGADGVFDLAVNGGGWLEVAYRKEGHLPAWRQVSVPWQEYVFLPDVTLLPSSSPVGVLELSAEEPEQVLRAKAIEDKEGKRQPTLLAPKGLEAVMFLPEGDKQSPNRLNVQLTEYTAAPRASAVLPAPPPPGTACAYAVEVSAAEAAQAGARDVRFNKSVIHYVENYLKFPTGTVLPVSRFVADKTAWAAAPDGRVVELLSVSEDGLADLDVEGGGKAADSDSLAKLGVTEAERRQLAGLYKPHEKLWRIPLAHLGTWAVLPPTRLPDGAVAPRWGLARLASELPAADLAGGPPPEAPNQVVRQAVPVTGTPYQLVYHSDRAPGGRKGAYNVSVSLTGAELPRGLKRVEVEVLVAGFRITQRHPIPQPNVTVGFTWDGKDAFGRPVQGARPAVVRVGYFYDATYPYPAAGPGVPAREPAALWTEQRMMLGDWDGRGQDLGGWTLDALHSYDPVGRVLHLGGGGRQDGRTLPLVIDRFVGGRVGVGLLKDIGDDGPALKAALSTVRGLAVSPDGSLYLADAGQNRVRRVDAAGTITTVAGSANDGYDGDGRPGPDAKMRGPAGLAVAADGSLYIADDGNDRIRRVGPDGFIHTVAGRGGRDEYGGDGGLALEAKLSRMGGLAAGPDGSLYVAQNAFYQCIRRIGPDGVINRLPVKADFGSACGIALATNGVLYLADAEGHRVWRIAADGTATVAAGTGKPGFSGDGGPAAQADLNTPTAVAAGLDGMLYIADAGNHRLRRVDPNGVLTTVAGSGQPTTSQGGNGDGGPALLATFQLAEQTHGQPSFLSGLAVGPEGDLYVADDQGRHVRRMASPFSGFSEGEITLSSADDRERYVFDGAGRHLRTLDPAGKAVCRFVYDKAGRLAEVHDAADAATRIERDAEGAPTALVAPDGRRSVLQVGADGYLSRVTDPAGGAVEMAYDAEGLLRSYTDAHGTTGFKYDEGGRLVK